mmetsp:Transcript_29488/g.75011  ORF Transcript_29488/g.75011 Transcript_29488/m.75011 type:complete len:353 (-) Transcript_29488:2139-3197(-)
MKTEPRCFSARGLPDGEVGPSGESAPPVIMSGKYVTSTVAVLFAGMMTSRGHEKKVVPGGSTFVTCGCTFQSESWVFCTSMVFVASLRTSVVKSSVFVSPVLSTQQPVASSVSGPWPSKTQRMSFAVMRAVACASAEGSLPRFLFSAFLISKTRSRVGWKATVRGISSCGRTKPSDGVTEKTLANRPGSSNLYLAPRSPKLHSFTMRVDCEPTTTSPKKTECSLRRTSVAWHVPSTVRSLTSTPPSHLASTGSLNGAMRVVGEKISSMSIVSLGRSVTGAAGEMKIDLLMSSSPSPVSSKVTGRGERFTSRTVLLTVSPPVVTPKLTCCISIFASSSLSWHPRPRMSTFMRV